MDSLQRLAAQRGFDLAWLCQNGLVPLPGGGVGITYYDEAGNEQFVRERDVPGRSKRFHQPKGVSLLPYGLWRLGDCADSSELHITEGETDCLSLWTADIPALGIPGKNAAGCLRSEHLAGITDLILCPDNEKDTRAFGAEGLAFEQAISQRLNAIGYTGRLYSRRLPPGSKDVCEFRSSDPDSFLVRFRALKPETLSFGRREPEPPPAAEAEAEAERVPEPLVVRLEDVIAERVSFLWSGWMPEGALVVLDGDPGLGKSSLTLDLAARLSRGVALPPLEGSDVGRGPMGTLLMGAEDSLSHTVRPRLDAMGADCSLIYSLEGFVSAQGNERPVVLPGDLERMEAFVAEKNIKLVVVDPLMAYLGSDTDAHKDQDIRRCLRPMHKFAERLGIVVLLVRHLNKLSGGPALYRGGSSIGITGAARASLIVGRDPMQDRFILAMNKINIGPKPTSLAYRIEGSGLASRIIWLGEVDLRPDQILGHGPTGAMPGGRGRPASASDQARQFLIDLLRNGPRPTAEVYQAASEQMISERTLKRARADLGIVPSKRPDGTYVMALPDDWQAGTQNFGRPQDERTPFEEGDDTSTDSEGTCDDRPF